MKIDSLSEKLILYFVLLGLGSIFLIGSVVFFSTRSALIDRTFDQLTSLRNVKKNSLEQFYSDRFHDAGFLAAALFCTGTGSQPVQNRIGSFGAAGRYFSGYFVAGPEDSQECGSFPGAVATRNPTSQEIAGFREKLRDGTVALSDVFRDTGGFFQFVAVRIPDRATKGRERLLILTLSMKAVDAIMLNNDPRSGLGLSGETYLVGADRFLRSTSRFLSNSMLGTRCSTSPAVKALTGGSGTLSTTDYRGIPVLSSYEPLKVGPLNWAILAEIDLQEAMVPVSAIRRRILLLSALIMVVFFASVLLISRRITRPLIRLRNAAVSMGGGDYNIDLPVETDDEIGALTRSFNVMADRIREKTNELKQERTGRMRSVFDGEEMERQRLSRELHDGIGQSLVAVRLRLESLTYQQPGDIGTSIRELRNYFDQIIDEVRRISNNLAPSVLEVFSLPIAFRNLFNETEEHSSLKILFEAKGNFEDLDKKLKTYIYRLMQEALNNIVKHASAREVRVELIRLPERLTLFVEDNGKGFIPEHAGQETGNGIHNMRERAALLQGQLEIVSAPGKGTTIRLNVPILPPNVKNQDFPRG